MLFVCGRNRLRSPTAEQVFADWSGVETASAGIRQDADVPVSVELLAWADVVLVMEPVHGRVLASRFAHALRGKRVACLGIPDCYGYMEPALVVRLKQAVPLHLHA